MTERPIDVAHDGRLFPREELLAAVAGADWRDRPVPRLNLAALAVGLALVTYAAPIRRPLLVAELVTDAEGDLLSIAASTLVWGLGHLGLGHEQAWFTVAALASAGALLALFALGRALGVGPRLALTVALVCAAAPTSALGATLPTAHGLAVIGVALVLRAGLVAARHGATAPPPAEAVGRLAGAAAMAHLLHAESALLALVLVGAAYAARRTSAASPTAPDAAPHPATGAARDTSARVASVASVASVGWVGWVAAGVAVLGLARAWLAHVELEALAPALAALRPPWPAVALALLPVTLLALDLCRVPREAHGDTPEEAPAPAWLRLAVPLALAGLALAQLGSPPLGFGAALVPLAALALANRMNRHADPLAAARALAGVGLAVAAVTVTLEVAARRWDRAPVEQIRAALAGGPPLPAGELDAETLYLLRFRFGLEPADVPRR